MQSQAHNNMENKQNNLVKIALIVLALASIVIVGWIIFSDKPPAPVEDSNQKAVNQKESSVVKPVTPQVVQESEEKNSNLQELSQNIPHYEETEKIESYTLKYPDSTQTQDVYRFFSSKSMDENLSYYTEWAGKNEWKIENTVKENEIYSLYLIRNNQTLVVKINTIGEKVKVSLDFLTDSL